MLTRKRQKQERAQEVTVDVPKNTSKRILRFHLNRTEINLRMEQLREQAREYAAKKQAEWTSKYARVKLVDGDYFITDPLKYEEAAAEYNSAYHEYLEKHTVSIPNSMID